MFIFNWFISTAAIIITAYLIPSAHITVLGALVAAILLLTLPLNVLTLGLFTLVINGVMILIAAAIVPGFHVGGLGKAMIFSIVLALINMLFLRAR
jgi:putative membrane protein